ncbi:MAG: hypothetical protein ABFD61_05745 [Chloroherpetonaceae bacterium]
MDTIKIYNLGSIETRKGKSVVNVNTFRIYINKKDGKLNSHVIMFSGDSEFVSKKLMFMNLAENTLTGEMFIVFSKENGAELKKLNKNETCSTVGTQRNMVIREVANILGIDYSNGISCSIKLSNNLSKNDDNITYKVLEIE